MSATAESKGIAESTGIAAEPSGVALGRIALAEFFGTLVLVLVGPGTAILAFDAVGSTVGVALAFGVALLAMAYAIGHVSGCHINPAVTLGFVVTGKLDLSTALWYWLAQLTGGIGGAAILFGITQGGDVAFDKTGSFAANGWGEKFGNTYGLGSVALVEIIFTALLIFVVLSSTTKRFPAGFGGLAAGLTLAGIHLATIPVDNTSVNPARSLATAIFSGGDALGQVWAFFVFPLVGGVLGAVIFALVHDHELDIDL